MMIGERLRKLIKRRGFKQVEVCRAVGLSPSRLSNYLSGSREPDLETLSRIAKFLNVKLDYFAYGDSVKNSKDIGERVVKLREMLGMSKAELSVQTGLEPSFIAKVELGHGELDNETLELIAKALRCDSEYLIGSYESDIYETAFKRVAENHVEYAPGDPSAFRTIKDVASGRTDSEKEPIWVVMTDGRFAPFVNEGEMLYITKLENTLPVEGNKVLLVVSENVHVMKCFEYQDSVLLTPETDDGEPVFVSRDGGFKLGTKCYKINWHAKKY